uniref:LITAF domain-containing protein n=1 Tax=Setaria digitata TaxID=48799 RepID=A0A915PPA9_9BILA
MNSSENDYTKSPPSYEAAVDPRNTGGKSQTSGISGPFPASPQPPLNPAYIPQTVNPTPLDFSTMHPEPQTIPVIVGVPIFGPRSCTMTCPNCNKAIVTETRTHAGLLAFAICGILLLFGCDFLKSCCPFLKWKFAYRSLKRAYSIDAGLVVV